MGDVAALARLQHQVAYAVAAQSLVLPQRQRDVVVDAVLQPAKVASVSVTAGFVWWVTRGGGMLATVLMGVPAWRHIDLLPVLSKPDEDDDEEGEGEAQLDDEAGLDDLFDRRGRAAPGKGSNP